jgi:hypothetical protein
MNSIIAEKKFISERTGIPYSNLSQAYLRAETLLANLSSYSFELQKNNVASPNVTERLLNLNDEFVISHMTVALKTVANTETDTDHLISTLANYGVTEDGTITNGEAIYNSSLSMIIDRKEFLPNYAFVSSVVFQTNRVVLTLLVVLLTRMQLPTVCLVSHLSSQLRLTVARLSILQ